MRLQSSIRCPSFLLLFLLQLLLKAALATSVATSSTNRAPPITPVNTDAVTCSLEDCTLMCLCQKLLWIIDYNHPDAAEPTDQICVNWANKQKPKQLFPDGKKGEECLTGCLVIAQFIDAAAGRDPNICQRARDSVTNIGILDKENQ